MSETKPPDFLSYLLHQKGMSKASSRAYANDVNRFILWLKRNKAGWDWHTLTSNDIYRYLRSHKHRRSYQNRILASLRAAYDYLISMNHASSNPAREVKRKKAARKPKTVKLSIDDIQQLLKAARTHSSRHEWRRNLALILILQSTNLSSGELCSLRMQELSFEGQDPVAVTVMRQGQAQQLVFSRRARKALKGWLRYRERFTLRLAPEPIEQTLLWEHLTPEEQKHYELSARFSSDKIWLITSGRKQGLPLSPQGLRFMLKHFAELAGIEKNVTPLAIRAAKK